MTVPAQQSGQQVTGWEVLDGARSKQDWMDKSFLCSKGHQIICKQVADLIIHHIWLPEQKKKKKRTKESEEGEGKYPVLQDNKLPFLSWAVQIRTNFYKHKKTKKKKLLKACFSTFGKKMLLLACFSTVRCILYLIFWKSQNKICLEQPEGEKGMHSHAVSSPQAPWTPIQHPCPL